MTETVHVLCDNGSVMEHDLPLPAGIADRVARGDLRLVNPDGTDITAEPSVVDDPVAEVPSGSVADVVAWVGEDRERAAMALEVEAAKGDNARKTLIAGLTELLGA